MMLLRLQRLEQQLRDRREANEGLSLNRGAILDSTVTGLEHASTVL